MAGENTEGVKINFSGDSAQLLAEIAKLTGGMKRMEQQAAASSSAAQAQTGQLMARFQKFQQGASATAGAISAMAAASGAATSKAGQLAQAGAAIGGAFVAGGPIAAGVAIIGLLVTKYMEATDAAEKMRLASAAAIVSGGQAIQDAIIALEAQSTGLSAEQLKVQDEINFQMVRRGDLQARLDELDTDALERWQGYVDKGIQITKEQERQLELWRDITTNIDDAQSMLDATSSDLERINELQDRIKANAEAEATARERSARAIDQQFRRIVNAAAREGFTQSVLDELSTPLTSTERDELDRRVSGIGNAMDRLRSSVLQGAEALQAAFEETTRRQQEVEIDILRAKGKILRDVEDIARDFAQQRAEANASFAGEMTSAAVGGSGFAQLGNMAGSALGGVVAPMVGVDPLTGSAIGGVIGQLVGGLLDKLEPVMGILDILINDGIAGIVAALGPIFEELLPLAGLIADVLGIVAAAIGPAVGAVAGIVELVVAIVSVVAPMVQLAEVVLLALGGFNVIAMALGAMADGVRWWTTLIERAALAMADFIDGVMGTNLGDELRRQMSDVALAAGGGSGGGGRSLSSMQYGRDYVQAEGQSFYVGAGWTSLGDMSAQAGSAAAIGDIDADGILEGIMETGYTALMEQYTAIALMNQSAVEENTAELKRTGDKMANMPKGWRRELAAYFAQDPVASPTPPATDSGGGGLNSQGRMGGGNTLIMIGGRTVAEVNAAGERFRNMRRSGGPRPPAPGDD